VTPSPLAAAQRKQPRLIPAPAVSAARRPLTAAARRTSTLSRPGVTVTIAATAAKASIDSITHGRVTGLGHVPCDVGVWLDVP
jgi:hypothetical protein